MFGWFKRRREAAREARIERIVQEACKILDQQERDGLLPKYHPKDPDA